MTETSDSTHFRLPLTVRVAALLFVFLGLAFGASVPLVLAYLDRYGELPMTFGFRSMAGPFEQLGPEAFKALGWTFVGVSVADVVAGLGLWRGRRWGPGWGSLRRPWRLRSGLGSTCPSSSSACQCAWPSFWRVAAAWADVLASSLSCVDTSSPLPGRSSSGRFATS